MSQMNNEVVCGAIFLMLERDIGEVKNKGVGKKDLENKHPKEKKKRDIFFPMHIESFQKVMSQTFKKKTTFTMEKRILL